MESNRPTNDRTGEGFIPSPTYEVPLPSRSVHGSGKDRTNVVYVRLNDGDKDAVDEAARLLGLTIQEFAHGAVTGFAKEVLYDWLEDNINLVSTEEGLDGA